jgi:hypothetical protein
LGLPNNSYNPRGPEWLSELNHHTIAYSTPCAPFEVWQVDLVEPLPISPEGFSYALIAVAMFSKYLISIPLVTKTAITGFVIAVFVDIG